MRVGPAILLLEMMRLLQSMSIDNSIIGTPTVQCERDYIRFSVNTEKPFKGKVFVKGEYTNDQCVRNFAQTTTGGGHGKEGNVGSTLLRTSSPLADREVYGSMSGINDHLRCPPCPVCENGRRTTRQAGTVANIDIQLGTCNTKRARSLSPPGVTISFTIVVSFHENFVTKVDRAYRIQCAYAEIDKTVTTKIDVSMPQSTELTGTIDSPKCEYRIKGQSGEPVKNVRVGDIIEHEWSCSGGTAGTYAILVSNCYAEGGDHQKELVIDKRGCSLDSFVIPTPEYNNNEMLATAKSIVFKFPDRTDIGFQCDILVCARGENICDQLTPPKCEVRQRRALINDSSLSAWRLHAEPLNVIDIDENIGDDELAALNRINNKLSSSFSLSTIAPFCISLANFALIIAFSTFFFTISTAIVAFIFLFKDTLQK